MKCIIVEDQAPAQRILQKYIENTASLSLEKTFFDAIAAKDYLVNNPVDLVFLDINLPRLSGMDFLQSIQYHSLTILTTAYSEFALESYQFNVVDYLLKPFSFERFSQAIEKLHTMSTTIRQIAEPNNFTSDKYVYIKSSYDLVKVDRDDIVFIKSDSDYTEIVTQSDKYLASVPLRDWIIQLGEDFKQVHKSYIVNIAHLRKISHNKIYLSVDYIVPIGRAFKGNIMKVRPL